MKTTVRSLALLLVGTGLAACQFEVEVDKSPHRTDHYRVELFYNTLPDDSIGYPIVSFDADPEGGTASSSHHKLVVRETNTGRALRRLAFFDFPPQDSPLSVATTQPSSFLHFHVYARNNGTFRTEHLSINLYVNDQLVEQRDLHPSRFDNGTAQLALRYEKGRRKIEDIQ